MAGSDRFEGCFQIGERFNAVDFRRFDQGCDAAPGFSAFVVAGKQRIFTAESQFPFILPMSGNFTGSTIDGTRISAPM
jgi:hypothetical protein